MGRCSLILLLLVFLSACSTTTQTKLVGLVQSSKTDDSDNPVEIYLWDGKTPVPIEENPNQQVLLDKVDSKIEAEGELTETYSGKKSFLVKKYKILKEAGE